MGLESFNSRNMRHFFGVGFFYHFSSSKSYFLKYSCNIKKFFFVKYKEFLEVFRFPKYNKTFFLENVRNFLVVELESSISPNIRKYKNFFYFLSLGLKSALSSYVCKTLHRRCLTVFWIYKGSEYASSSCQVLNTPGLGIYL